MNKNKVLKFFTSINSSLTLVSSIVSALVMVLSLALPMAAMGGAISAEGMEAPASLECIFPMPGSEKAFLDFIMYDFDSNLAGSLASLKVGDKEFSFYHSAEGLQKREPGAELTTSYEFHAGGKQYLLQVSMHKPISIAEPFAALKSFHENENYFFIEHAHYYRAHLATGSDRFEGYCAPGDFLRYYLF